MTHHIIHSLIIYECVYINGNKCKNEARVNLYYEYLKFKLLLFFDLILNEIKKTKPWKIQTTNE